MLVVDRLVKTYRRASSEVEVLRGLDVEVHAGEFLAVVGSSGSGKSTFLHLLGALDVPDSGSIHLDGARIDTARGAERDKLLNETFGYIFQFYHLLPELSTLENVLMPAYVRETPLGWLRNRRTWRKRADELLERVGLGHRTSHRPRELSGGEMQRAAVARSLLTKPRVLLADEPTGNLDSETGAEIVELLRSVNRDDRVTTVLVTHNPEIAAQADRVVRMAHGKLVVAPPNLAVAPEPLLAAG